MAIETIPTDVKIIIENYFCSECGKRIFRKTYSGLKDKPKYKYTCYFCEHVEYLNESYPILYSVLNSIKYKMEGVSVDGFINIFKLNMDTID